MTDDRNEAPKSEENIADHSLSSQRTPDSFPGGLAGCLEAILISAEEPLKTDQIAAVLHLEEPAVERGLEHLSETYKQRGSGIALRHSARGWRLGSAKIYDSVVSAFLTNKHAATRLSHAALEALAIIAYKQPITREGVSSVRGVASDALVRSLILRGLVSESDPKSGTNARTLVTTDLFLERLGISSLSELPPLAPFLPPQSEALREANSVSSQAGDANSGLSHVLGSLKQGGNVADSR